MLLTPAEAQSKADCIMTIDEASTLLTSVPRFSWNSLRLLFGVVQDEIKALAVEDLVGIRFSHSFLRKAAAHLSAPIAELDSPVRQNMSAEILGYLATEEAFTSDSKVNSAKL